jgi:hypothetical protein
MEVGGNEGQRGGWLARTRINERRALAFDLRVNARRSCGVQLVQWTIGPGLSCSIDTWGFRIKHTSNKDIIHQILPIFVFQKTVASAIRERLYSAAEHN